MLFPILLNCIIASSNPFITTIYCYCKYKNVHFFEYKNVQFCTPLHSIFSLILMISYFHKKYNKKECTFRI